MREGEDTDETELVKRNEAEEESKAMASETYTPQAFEFPAKAFSKHGLYLQDPKASTEKGISYRRRMV